MRGLYFSVAGTCSLLLAWPNVGHARDDCRTTRQVGSAVASITQEYDAAGRPERYIVGLEGGDYATMPDGSRAAIKIWQLARGAPDPGDFEQRLVEHGVFEMHILLRRPLTRPATLMFSRGPYINIDLGLGKLVLPRSVRGDGYVVAMDTLRHWRDFAEGEATVGWSLDGTASLSDHIEDGEFEMRLFEEGRQALVELAGQFVASMQCR